MAVWSLLHSKIFLMCMKYTVGVIKQWQTWQDQELPRRAHLSPHVPAKLADIEADQGEPHRLQGCPWRQYISLASMRPPCWPWASDILFFNAPLCHCGLADRCFLMSRPVFCEQCLLAWKKTCRGWWNNPTGSVDIRDIPVASEVRKSFTLESHSFSHWRIVINDLRQCRIPRLAFLVLLCKAHYTYMWKQVKTYTSDYKWVYDQSSLRG